MSCANRCSSRPPPPTCSRSSALRLASWSRCSRPCWLMRRGYVRPSLVKCSDTTVMPFTLQLCKVCRQTTLRSFGARRFWPGPETVLARLKRTKQVAQIEDARAERGYAERDPMFVAAVERGAVRTILGVPMLKDNELVGAINIYRQQVRPFTDKQIELVQNFAA